MADMAGLDLSSLPQHDGISFKDALYPASSSSSSSSFSESPWLNQVGDSIVAGSRWIYQEFCYQQSTFGYGAGWGQSVLTSDGMHGIRMNKNYTAPAGSSDITWELFNTTADVSETTDLSGLSKYATLLSGMGTWMDGQHIESTVWPSGRLCVDHCYTGSCPRPGDMSIE